MFTLRRVVTATDGKGKSVVEFVDSGSNDLVSESYPGLVMHEIWATSETPATVDGLTDRAIRPIRIEPDQNGTIFRVIELPPDELMASVDDEKSLAEFQLREQPSPTARNRHRTMHRTATVDYLVVLSGEMWMILDDTEILLKPGTCVVQQAALHGFANRSSEYCVFAAVLLDAQLSTPSP